MTHLPVFIFHLYNYTATVSKLMFKGVCFFTSTLWICVCDSVHMSAGVSKGRGTGADVLEGSEMPTVVLGMDQVT